MMQMDTLIAEREAETTAEGIEPVTLTAVPHLPAQESPPAAAAQEAPALEDRILRFHVSERMLHWAIAIPFVICATTGLILLGFYDLHATGVSRNILSWTHRLGGLGLITLPLLSALKNIRDYRLHLKNIRHACTWTMNDFKWVILFGPAAFSSRIKLPDQHKFNAAEKVNFIVQLCTYPLFVVTGVILCLPEINFLAWIVHVGIALLAIPLIVGHIYMALINPSTRPGLGGMLSGLVNREWAKHHYHTWYRENFTPEQGPTENRERSS
jgi:formate dehydrogenase subunit gamma